MHGMPNLPDEVTTRQALDILGYSHPSTVIRYVREGTLTPTRKLPGVSGTYLFERKDIEKLRDRQASDRAAAQAERAAAGAS